MEPDGHESSILQHATEKKHSVSHIGDPVVNSKDPKPLNPRREIPYFRE